MRILRHLTYLIVIALFTSAAMLDFESKSYDFLAFDIVLIIGLTALSTRRLWLKTEDDE